MLATICSCHCSIRYSLVLEIFLSEYPETAFITGRTCVSMTQVKFYPKKPLQSIQTVDERTDVIVVPHLTLYQDSLKAVTNLLHNVGKLTRSSQMACTGLKVGSAWERAALESKTKLISLASKLRGKSALGVVVK